MIPKSKKISKQVTISNEVKIPEILVPFTEKNIALYNFITDVSKAQSIPAHEIVLAAIEHFIWFNLHINNGEEFFVEKTTEDGKRHRRKIKLEYTGK